MCGAHTHIHKQSISIEHAAHPLIPQWQCRYLDIVLSCIQAAKAWNCSSIEFSHTGHSRILPYKLLHENQSGPVKRAHLNVPMNFSFCSFTHTYFDHVHTNPISNSLNLPASHAVVSHLIRALRTFELYFGRRFKHVHEQQQRKYDKRANEWNGMIV